MNDEKDLTVKETFNLAVQNHQNNNLQEAQNYYQKVLKIDPNHSQALNNLAVIFTNLKEYQKAKSCYEKVIELNPNYAAAHNNLGVLLKELGEHQQAKSCFEKAIEINPNYAAAHYNLGVLLKELGEHQQAKSCFEKVIAIDPNYVKALNDLGVIFQELSDFQKAKDCYEKAIEINPNYADAHNNLGVIYKELREYQKAKDCYEKAMAISPDFIAPIKNISQLYSNELSLEKATSLSYKALKMYRDKFTFTDLKISLNRLKHDVQQAKYLSSKNYEVEGLDLFQKVGDKILSRKENKEVEDNSSKKILLNPNEINSLLPFYKSDHVYQTKEISGNCINPNKNWLDVEDEYLNSSNQIIYIDDFLSEEALIELREFCLVSRVWNKEYKNKYLGAFSGDGFISPIHLQIAKDLKEKLPKLFGTHHLAEFWGFKYDSTLGKGINIHADAAIHNLNFWITPDEYNNDKNSGGLKVYDIPAPDNWIFKDYNSNNDKIYKFLKDNNAKCINVPYKFNRAVLFNSAYFHETDDIDFKDVYEGRRINNTYLFGDRNIKV